MSPLDLQSQLTQFVEVLSANSRSLGSEPDYLAGAIEHWARWQSETCFTVLASQDGRPAAVVNFRWSNPKSRDVALEGLRVLPEHRGNGLSGRMLEAFLNAPEVMRRRPFALRDVVATDNAGANAIARKLGMSPTVSIQTLEHNPIARVEAVSTSARTLSEQDLQGALDDALGLMSSDRAPIGLIDWRPTPITAADLLIAAAERRVVGVGTASHLQAIALLAPKPCLIRDGGVQIAAAGASTSGAAHDLAVYFEGLRAAEPAIRSIIAHTASTSLLAFVMFSRGWQPNRWYQDIIYHRAIAADADPKHSGEGT
ncbi:MAG: GNAT family N-acetyltransferase [Phycisphaerales bacterium]